MAHRRQHPESAAGLYRLPQPVLELALAKAKVVKLAEAVMELGKIEGITRKEALDRWLNEFNRGRVDRELKDELGVLSMSSVYRWRKAFNEKGMKGLVDKRGKHSRGFIGKDVRGFIETCVLTRPGMPSAEIFELMVFKFKDRQLPAKGTVKNLISQIRKGKAALITHLHHPSTFKQRHQPDLVRADVELGKLKLVEAEIRQEKKELKKVITRQGVPVGRSRK
ncbi:MAG: helix-turn-helix domain-containing protein [Deltaproteobacteria bacterium]|nr:helix-turn-helix domain-containing protein [Deltaproteobacteria bacterium]